MLDESLPTFLLKPSSDKPRQQENLLYSQHGSDYEPAYTLRRLDPDQHGSRNRYAVGLYDAYVPDVLYAEVLLIPVWTQPSLSADEIRRNGGVPPPPEALLPTEFTIQLYNPDLQVVVQYRPATFTKDAAWEFDMPQVTFREPSASALDRSQHDPVVSEWTPKIRHRWKKDGKFGKDLVCYQCGRRANPDGTRHKAREPDITLALFRALKEVTLYESNFGRIEIEDVKGFEVVLLLGAAVIRDVYFTPLKDTFHLGGRRGSASVAGPPGEGASTLLPPPALSAPVREPRVPPTDPLSEWQLEAESARLRQQAAAERREAERRIEAEQKQIRKMVEAEEKAARKEQAKIEQETERLRRQYGREDASARPSLPPTVRDDRRASSFHPAPVSMSPSLLPPSAPSLQSPPPPRPTPPGPYMVGAASQSSFLHPSPDAGQRLKQKSSIFSFRRQKSEDASHKLSKKRSAVF